MTPREQALVLLAGNIPPGPVFFQVAAQALAMRSGCRWAGIGELSRDGDSVKLLAFWDGDHQAEPFSFQLEGSPCLQVYESSPDNPHRFFPCDVAEQFADFPLLAQIGAHSYRGEVFHDSADRPIGHVFVISEQDEEDTPGITEFFRLVAQRVGAEYNRWRAEEALVASEQALRWYEHMVATTRDQMAFIDVSYTHRAINSKYLEAFSYQPRPDGKPWTRDDIVGHTLDEVFDAEFLESTIKPDLDHCFAGNFVSFERWVERPGRPRRYLLVSHHPYLSEDGSVHGAVVTIRDLTRRQQQLSSIADLTVHEAIAAGDCEKAAQLVTEAVAENLAVERVSVWLRDPVRRQLSCLDLFTQPTKAHSEGATLLLDDSPQYFETLDSAQPIAAHDACSDPRTAELVEGYLETLGIVSMLDAPIRVSGDLVGIVRLEHLRSRIWQADEITFAVEAAFLMAQTIINRDRQKAQAENVEMERFTYAVSHDLKSPLFTITGILGMLERDAARGTTDRLTTDIGKIRTATASMQQLINDLSELSRVGRVAASPQEVCLRDLAREAVELVGGKIAERSVRVEVSPDLPVVYGDRPRLLQVLQNLIENAVKFMGAQSDPRIEIGVRQDDEQAVCYVRDNGKGIDPRHHKRIFGLFERLDPECEGTGAGLAVVQRIVEVHGGRIWVESEGALRGSTFCFVIPPSAE